MHDMAAQTFAHEEGVVRYEYWKGQEANAYYCLLSFKDKLSFYDHQMSDHHEGHDFADVLEDIQLEYVDPVGGAGGGLIATADTPLPDDASDNQKIAQKRFPIDIAEWWSGRA